MWADIQADLYGAAVERGDRCPAGSERPDRPVAEALGHRDDPNSLAQASSPDNVAILLCVAEAPFVKMTELTRSCTLVDEAASPPRF